MMEKWILWIGLLAGCCACTESKPTIGLDNCDVVAVKKMVGKDTVIVCEQEWIKQHVTIPLSHLVADWKLLRLENDKEEAKTVPFQLYSSENHLFVIDSQRKGVLVYDKQGNYLRTIGQAGEGMYDFHVNAYQVQPDEQNDCIYVRDLNPERILQFRISDGKVLKSIPLSVNRCSEILMLDSVMLLARGPHFTIDEIGKKPLLWLQDLKGNMLQEVSSVGWRNRLASQYYLWNRSGNVTFCTSNADTLYHYNVKENRLMPRFTIHCSQERGPHVSMEDVSDYYLFMLAESVPNDFGYWYLPQKRIIVDKKTMKGAYIDIVLDGHGEMKITDKWFGLNGDYLTMALQPREVIAMCKEVLAREENIPSDEANRVRDLLEGIHEDDNSFVLYGKIK